MSWLKRLLGSGGPKPQAATKDAPWGERPSETPSSADNGRDRERIARDLKRLDQISAGLGEETVRYVCGAGNDSVLLKLQANKVRVGEILGDNQWNARKVNSGRVEFLLMAEAWRPDTLRRYGEVFAVFREDQTWAKLPGSPRSPHWFRALVAEYNEARSRVAPNAYNRINLPARAERPWTAAGLRSLLGDNPAPILDVAFEGEERWAWSRSDFVRPDAIPDFADHMRADPAARVAELGPLGAKERAAALRYLGRIGLVEGVWFDFAFDQCGDTAKSAREAAGLLLRSTPVDTVARRAETDWPKLRQGQKQELIKLLPDRLGGGAADVLRRLLALETKPSLKADLERALGQGSAAVEVREDSRPDSHEGYTALDGRWIEPPPLVPPPADTKVTPALEGLIKGAVEAWREEAERHNKAAGNRHYKMPMPSIGAVSTAVSRFDAFSTGESDVLHNIVGAWLHGKGRVAARARILDHADTTLWHLVRASRTQRGYNQQDDGSQVLHETPVAGAMRARMVGGADMRTYAAILAALKLPVNGPARALLASGYWRPSLEVWSGDTLWPYLLQHIGLLDEALGIAPASSKDGLSETAALDLLRQFPVPPARYRSALLDRAIGDRKAVRPIARELLSAAPGIEGLLIGLLDHPKAESRGEAAAWLAGRDAKEAIAPLLKAARKEKLPAPKAQMLAAISRLGGDIGEFVSGEALVREAKESLKKTPLKGLDWFPWAGMPTVRLTGGEALDPEALKAWLALAVKIKQPGGNPWFDLLLDLLEPADASRLGLAILQAWSAQDVLGPTDEAANAFAAAHVDGTFKQYQQWKIDMTREAIFAMLRRQKLREYYGSANDQKGILALATRASGPEAVALVRSYFRDHYARSHQCRALLECLAGNPSPVAIQFVLSISKRWRTPGVRARAGELVEAIAERRGWTAEELADRTIPTGGFDEDGVLELAIGDRIYTGRLLKDDRIELFNPDGKSVQGLPSSVAPTDTDALKEAKALLSTARKEVKQVVEFQTRRLYEGLCVEREWPVEDFDRYLLRHPLMGRLVQRLIWIALDADGKPIASFRPMEDLSLTDAQDGAVTLDTASRVRLAHRTALSEADQSAWIAHLADYEVAPLFEQLRRPAATLGPDEALSTEIIDRRGYMIETFKLRGAATKLGYTRGDAGDGGWFNEYVKPFDALGLVAVIGFTGSPLPEENQPGALTGLSFVTSRKGAWNWQGQPLKDIPKVLLSEAWNDFHEIAAAGTGFDAEWEKKAGW